MIALLAIVLTSCDSTNRSIITSYKCVDGLPQDGFTEYILRKVKITDELGDTLITTFLAQKIGAIVLKSDQSFFMKITGGRIKQEINGYFDVIAGFMFVYTDSTFKDIEIVFDYRYTRKVLILEYFDSIARTRIVTHWNRLPIKLYEY